MNPPTALLALFLLLLPTVSLDAATGSAETGDVTVDTRIARPRLTVGPSLGRANAKSVNLVSSRARPVSGFARVANAGNFTETYGMRARRGNRFFRVVYHAPSGNVTGRIVAGAHRSAKIAPGAADWVRALVRPNQALLIRRNDQGRRRVLRATHTLPFNAVSTTLSAADEARMRVRTR
jgi:hypothetical protein